MDIIIVHNLAHKDSHVPLKQWKWEKLRDTVKRGTFGCGFGIENIHWIFFHLKIVVKNCIIFHSQKILESLAKPNPIQLAIMTQHYLYPRSLSTAKYSAGDNLWGSAGFLGEC